MLLLQLLLLRTLSKQDLHAALRIATERDDLEGQGLWSAGLGAICLRRGALEDAERFVQSGLSAARTHGNRDREAFLLSLLGVIRAKQGAADEGRSM